MSDIRRAIALAGTDEMRFDVVRRNTSVNTSDVIPADQSGGDAPESSAKEDCQDDDQDDDNDKRRGPQS